MVLLAFFASLSIFFRYPNVLLMVPPAAALLLGRRVVFGHAVAALSIGAAFTLFILAFNAFVYGDPLTTGFHLGAELISETVNYSQESLFKWKPEVAYQYVETYTQIPFIAVPVAAGLVSATIVALKRGGTERMFAVVSLAVIGILFAYYGQQDAWGYRGPQLSASFLRYLLPGFALAILFAAWALASMSAYWRWAPHAGLATLLVSGAFYVWVGARRRSRGVRRRPRQLDPAEPGRCRNAPGRDHLGADYGQGALSRPPDDDADIHDPER